jgi:hypothetical protein
MTLLQTCSPPDCILRHRAGAPMPETGRQQFGREPSRRIPVCISHIELFGRSSEQVQFGREHEQPVPVGIARKK